FRALREWVSLIDGPGPVLSLQSTAPATIRARRLRRDLDRGILPQGGSGFPQPRDDPARAPSPKLPARARRAAPLRHTALGSSTRARGRSGCGQRRGGPAQVPSPELLAQAGKVTLLPCIH